MKCTMPRYSTIALATVLLGSTIPAFAQDSAEDHAAHHPENAATDATATEQPAPGTMPGNAQERMQAMRETDDMQARMAMMDAQLKDMQALMDTMPMGAGRGGPGGMMGGRGMMGGGSGGMMGGHHGMMTMHMRMMDMRLEMMQSMMQMMMQHMSQMRMQMPDADGTDG